MLLSLLIHLKLAAAYAQNTEGTISVSCSEWILHHFGHSLLLRPIGLGYLAHLLDSQVSVAWGNTLSIYIYIFLS